jgi:hypothetical protein
MRRGMPQPAALMGIAAAGLNLGLSKAGRPPLHFASDDPALLHLWGARLSA